MNWNEGARVDGWSAEWKDGMSDNIYACKSRRSVIQLVNLFSHIYILLVLDLYKYIYIYIYPVFSLEPE